MPDKKTLDALAAFTHAAAALDAAWTESEAGDPLTDCYPFRKSFDEVAADIAAWYAKYADARLNA